MINLLPPDAREAIKYAKYNRIIVLYLVVSVFAIGIMATLMYFGKTTLVSSKSDLTKTLARERAQIADLEKVNSEAKALSATIGTITTLLEKEVKFSYLLREIGSIMPRGAVLSSISLSVDTAKPIRFSVALDSAEKAGVLQQNLVESDLFLGADIINVSSGTNNLVYRYSADIQAYFDPAVPLNTLDDEPSEEAAETTGDADTALPPTNTDSRPEDEPVVQEAPSGGAL